MDATTIQKITIWILPVLLAVYVVLRFIDLGVLDGTGRQVSYAGPYDLQGKIYSEQDWYHEVNLRGVYVSDVFLGHRHLPHFVIAISREADTAAPDCAASPSAS